MEKTRKNWSIESVALALTLSAGYATANINITQSDVAAPTYGTTLNFDEVGGPTGVIASDSFAGIGLADIQAGDGVPNVNNWGGIVGPWIGSGNSFFGNFGVFMSFGSDLTNFSGQVWDPSGPPDLFGGGLGVFVFNDGVQVADTIIEPAWGGVGDSWIDISADSGMVFDEIRLVGFGFDPSTFVDNLSWNSVPAPSSLGLLGVVGLTQIRRRRRS